VEIVAKEDKKLRFRSENAEEINPLLIKEFSKENAPLLTLAEVPRTLEDVYLKVMAEANGEVIQ
jgi:hypothetical protein